MTYDKLVKELNERVGENVTGRRVDKNTYAIYYDEDIYFYVSNYDGETVVECAGFNNELMYYELELLNKLAQTPVEER